MTFMLLRYIYLLFIVFFCLLAENAFGQSGVYFKSKEVNLEHRTGIDLTSSGAIAYNEKFTIEFDISFRDLTIWYGHIFQLKEIGEGHQLDVISRDDDIFVVLDKQETIFELGLMEEHKGLANRWITFKMTVDASAGEIELVYDEQSVKDKIDFPIESKLEWSFGVVNRYGFDIDEVPPMSVRNIRFWEQGKLKHCWPLNYSGKEALKDSITGVSIELINPAWVADQHREWQRFRGFEFSEMPQVAFNQDTEEIYFVQRKQSLTKFNLGTKQVSHVAYQAGNPYYEDAQQVFFDKKNNLYVYSDYKNRPVEFDENTGSWNNSFDTIPYLPKYWHHNSLLHPVDSAFVTIGGYGFFTYFNSIRKLNLDKNSWDMLAMRGDIFAPRYLASLGQSQSDQNIYFYFGGLGNESGKQILGKQFFYDLYRLDFEAGYISKVWELGDEIKENFTPVNSLVVNNEEGCFYTLCFKHDKKETSLQLIRASLDKPEFAFIGSKISYIFHDTYSFADLYHWKSHNSLLSITVHRNDAGRYEVNIFTMNYPPVGMNWEQPAVTNKVSRRAIYIVIFLLVFIIIEFIIVALRKRRQADDSNEEGNGANTDVELFASMVGEKGRILTFGGFQVFNKAGDDITFRFSPTLKELFLLILLNTLDDNRGISSKKIQEYLWPDKNDLKAKNNRGVNIKKLRAILEEVGDVAISYDGSYWRFSHGSDVFCDVEYMKVLFDTELQELNITEFSRILGILNRGSFLTNIEVEWLDKIKDETTGKILSNLEAACDILDLKNDSKILSDITDVLFKFDQVNETALEYKCKILNMQGKHSLALEVYNHYIKLYYKLYKEDFRIGFKELTKMN